MGRFSSFVIGFALGALTILGSLKYHVLRTDEGVEVVPKLSATFSETYLDVRGFGVGDWTEHKSVMAAVVQAKKEYLFKDAAATELVDSFGGMLEGLGFSREP